MTGFKGNLVTVLAAAMLLVSYSAQAAQIKKGFAMCRDQASLRRLVEASVASDVKTVQTLMKGPCKVIGKAQKVRVVTKTATLAQISVGKHGRWWTVIEAVR